MAKVRKKQKVTMEMMGTKVIVAKVTVAKAIVAKVIVAEVIVGEVIVVVVEGFGVRKSEGTKGLLEVKYLMIDEKRTTHGI